MAYTPHSDSDIKSMLEVIGVDNIDQLFDEIPKKIKCDGIPSIDNGHNEFSVKKEFKLISKRDPVQLNFIGAGAYQHYIPSAVWALAARGEFSTAYTPYQAEASQGSLQIIYEYQTMIASLTGMDVSNASMYEGASAFAESVLMAIRANKKSKSKKVLIAGCVAPNYLKVLTTITTNQGVTFDQIDFKDNSLSIEEHLAKYANESYAAVAVMQPNFLGQLVDVDTIANWAHERNYLVIGIVNPIALFLIKPPGSWGDDGADIVCGEGQPLGIPLAGGGPYFGFMACKTALTRQIPGRIVGKTTDAKGVDCYCLTLQAREQHIRRSKATSNICTNQGLMVTASTIFMSMMGNDGLESVANCCHENIISLAEKLVKIQDISLEFDNNYFHEIVVNLPCTAQYVIEKLSLKNIQVGYDLSVFGEDWSNKILICSTEVHDDSDHDLLVEALKFVIEECASC
ncbi:MAG: glycine dehydrogenase subunit 1 [Francisellaceae bacterium]|jgi:glycine dehydrogenase subunit 1